MVTIRMKMSSKADKSQVKVEEKRKKWKIWKKLRVDAQI